MSSPYVVSALTCAGALSANSIAVTTTLSTTGAVTATGGLTSFLLASSSTNLTLRTPAGFSIVAGGASATQAAGQATVLVVGQPGTGTDLFYVTAAGSGSGSSTVVSTVPTTVSNTLNVTGTSTLAAITGTTLGLSSTLSVPDVSTLGTANITTLGVSGVSTLAAVNCAAVTATSSGTVLTAQSSSTTSVIMASLLASSANSGQGQTLQLGRTSTTGNVFEITTYMQGDNNSGSTVYFNYKGRDQHFILRNDTERTTQYYGRLILPTLHANGQAIVDGQGAYLSWNDGADGSTYFNNQLGGGAEAGWKFRPYTSGNVAGAHVARISQEGVIYSTLGNFFTEGTFTEDVYSMAGATKYSWLTLGAPEYLYQRLGYNLVSATFKIPNMTYNYNVASSPGATVWFGNLPKFGRTIDFNSFSNSSTAAGISKWGTTYSTVNGRQFQVSARDAGGNLSPDSSSVCFLYNEATLGVIDVETSVISIYVTFEYRLY